MRKLLAGAVLMAAPFVCAPLAHADDDDPVTDTAICTAWRLGETPDQIATQLQSTPRTNYWQAQREVGEQLIERGC